MGGAYESLGYGADAVVGNPAAMTLYKRYVVEASGTWDIPLGFGHAAARIMDSTRSVGGGVSYDFFVYGPADARRWAHVVTVSLAVPIFNWLHLGVAMRNHNVLGATNTKSVTLNAGVVVRPGAWLQLGFSAHNIIPNYNVDVTRYFVASASSLIAKQVTLAFDVHLDFNLPEVRAAYYGGAEWLIAQTVPIRIGYEFDAIMKRQYISTGIGYFNRGSGVDFAYRHEFGGLEGRMVSLTVKFQF